jgi:putative SOS response-associated peptidase YedK
MCGRFSLFTPEQQILERFGVSTSEPLIPRYNIAPTQNIAVITQEQSKQVTFLKWGLTPSWSSESRNEINARAESVAEKKSFQTSFLRQRCLVVADGFYEWKDKQPYRFTLQEGLFVMAGIYAVWQGVAGVAIITTQANEFVKKVHTRMPVILQREDEALWLSEETSVMDLHELLVPSTQVLLAKPVSTKLNNARNEGKELLTRKQQGMEAYFG